MDLDGLEIYHMYPDFYFRTPPVTVAPQSGLAASMWLAAVVTNPGSQSALAWPLATNVCTMHNMEHVRRIGE